MVLQNISSAEPMKYLLAAVVAMAGVIAGISISVAGIDVPFTVAALTSASQHAFVLQLDWLQNLIERLDRLLESLVDLMKTLQQLFGGGGGEG